MSWSFRVPHYSRYDSTSLNHTLHGDSDHMGWNCHHQENERGFSFTAVISTTPIPFHIPLPIRLALLHPDSILDPLNGRCLRLLPHSPTMTIPVSVGSHDTVAVPLLDEYDDSAWCGCSSPSGTMMDMDMDMLCVAMMGCGQIEWL